MNNQYPDFNSSKPSFEAHVSERPRIVEQREAELTNGMDNLYFAFGPDIVNAIVSTIPGVSAEKRPQTQEVSAQAVSNVVELDAYRKTEEKKQQVTTTAELVADATMLSQSRADIDAAFEAFPEPIDYFIGEDDVQEAA